MNPSPRFGKRGLRRVGQYRNTGRPVDSPLRLLTGTVHSPGVMRKHTPAPMRA